MAFESLLGIFIGYPFLALLLSVIFVLLYTRCKRKAIFIAAIAWFAYFPYEYAMKLRILCSGECNIRVDLLLFYPILIIISIVGLVVFFKSKRS